MSRCPDCGMKECCGGPMSEEIDRLRAAILAIEDRAADNTDDRETVHAAHKMAREVLTTNAAVKPRRSED